MRDTRASAVVVEIREVEGSKSRTESIMVAALVVGSAIMYCQVAVTGSKIVWISGWISADIVSVVVVDGILGRE